MGAGTGDCNNDACISGDLNPETSLLATLFSVLFDSFWNHQGLFLDADPMGVWHLDWVLLFITSFIFFCGLTGSLMVLSISSSFSCFHLTKYLLRAICRFWRLEADCETFLKERKREMRSLFRVFSWVRSSSRSSFGISGIQINGTFAGFEQP